MKNVIANALTALIIMGQIGFSQMALAEAPYSGGDLKCVGGNEQIFLNATDATITRNGIVYISVPTQSFAFWYFSAYDVKTNQSEGWDLHVFSVSDDEGPGNSFIFIASNNQSIPVNCVRTDGR